MGKTEHSEDIKRMREDYTPLKEKYGLPEFEILAEDFDIERIAERETSFVLRDIRKVINDKISGALHLFETLANPVSPPMFIFLMLKNASEDETKKIKELYKKIAKIEIGVLKLDTKYDENQEAVFIKSVFKKWQTLKVEIKQIIDKLDEKFEMNDSSSKKGYYG